MSRRGRGDLRTRAAGALVWRRGKMKVQTCKEGCDDASFAATEWQTQDSM